MIISVLAAKNMVSQKMCGFYWATLYVRYNTTPVSMLLWRLAVFFGVFCCHWRSVCVKFCADW